MKTWGNWTLRKSTNELIFKIEDYSKAYEVDLDRCQDYLEKYDWIMQVAEKRDDWITNEDLGCLVRALMELKGR